MLPLRISKRLSLAEYHCTIIMNRENPENLTESESSDQDDEVVDPKIASLSTHELMIKLYMKVSKIEEKNLPKIKKRIKNLEASQVETNEKIEIIEEKQKENQEKFERNKEENDFIKESVKQINHEQRTNKNEIKAITDELDNKLDKSLTK